ncbi:TIGR01777 family oxidoreductase [Kordia algicida OT-1]|uniref:Possible sugar nucleotide epimerase n=1 Tax=Kordia algicida OT-1 TaxID=391587 RepID=A9E725_9FLAO|nr:TIGR01777 family oxidoreductase [Kordia algicida]EDP94867.1 possible sugar nucleotide epimerase [Kordia algicida OT-1]
MKILICGETGLIGSALSERCLKENHQIHYLTTRKSKIEASENRKGFLWNPAKGEIDEACFEGVDAIVNLSGANIAKRWTESYKQEILASRVDTANVLFKALQNRKDHTVKHYVSASGTAIYPSSLTENYSEDIQNLADDFLGSVVKQWELHANQFKSLEIPVTILRTGLVFAANGGALVEMVKPVKYGVGAAIGSGKQWQSWIHIKDIAGIYYHVLTNNIIGVYNAVAPNPTTNKLLTKEIAAVLNKPFFMPNIPKFMMKLILGEMSTLLLSSQKVDSEKIENTGFKFNYPMLTPALENILKK